MEELLLRHHTVAFEDTRPSFMTKPSCAAFGASNVQVTVTVEGEPTFQGFGGLRVTIRSTSFRYTRERQLLPVVVCNEAWRGQLS